MDVDDEDAFLYGDEAQETKPTTAAAAAASQPGPSLHRFILLSCSFQLLSLMLLLPPVASQQPWQRT